MFNELNHRIVNEVVFNISFEETFKLNNKDNFTSLTLISYDLIIIVEAKTFVKVKFHINTKIIDIDFELINDLIYYIKNKLRLCISTFLKKKIFS